MLKQTSTSLPVPPHAQPAMPSEICLLCGVAMDLDTKTPCETCHQTLCQTCLSWHPCLASKHDFSDSPSTSPRESATTEEATEEATSLRERACHESPAFVYAGIAQIKEDVYIHCESFDELSYVTLSTDFCGYYHCFGQVTADFQLLCELSAWDLPEGLCVVNANLGKSLIFQSGVIPSSLAIWSAIHYLRARQSIGLIMHYGTDGWFYYSLVEVHRYVGHDRKFCPENPGCPRTRRPMG